MRPIVRSLSLPALAAVTALAASASSALAADAPSAINPHGFKVPTGTHRCELNRSIDVRSVAADQSTAVLGFDRKEYRMQAVVARSGALRYEDPSSGLVWLVIATKSMLLDTKNGRQLANECKT